MRTQRILPILALALGLVFRSVQVGEAGPDEGDFSGRSDTGTFTGDQHSGIVSGIDFTSPPITVLNVNTLLGPISPTSGASGIYLFNNDGAGLTVNAGVSDANIVINTQGDDAYGIHAVSEGAPASYAWAPGLGVLEPAGTSGAGGGRSRC